MLDARPTLAHPAAVKREDYRPPEWRVPEIALELELAAERTIVRARLEVERGGDHKLPLKLDAEGLDILSVTVDGAAVDYGYEGDRLLVPAAGERATVATEVAI